jgi:Protein of unknown function (DUF1566)
MHQGSMSTLPRTTRRSSRARVALRVVATALALALPVSADAPISGADQQYANFDSNNKIITDRFTHLVWERPSAPYPPAMTFAEAKNACKGTMRLPSLKELLTLVDEQPHSEYEGTRNVPRYIDQSAFPNTPAEPFWTSSMKGESTVWTVDFLTGETKEASTGGDLRRVRCVDYVP